MTVGELKTFIEENNIPDNAKILVERVEDVYFEKRGWSVIKKENDGYISEYHPAWCGMKFKGDDNLYIDLHF